MKSFRTNPINHAAEGDERIRTAELSLGTDPVYEYGFHLTCGHDVVLGRAASLAASWNQLDALPRRADGWYPAHKCWACGLRRAVGNSFERRSR